MEAAAGLDDGPCMTGLGSVALGGAGGRRWSWCQPQACRRHVSASSANDFVSWFMYHERRCSDCLTHRAHSPDTGECARHLSRVLPYRLWYRARAKVRADGPDAGLSTLATQTCANYSHN